MGKQAMLSYHLEEKENNVNVRIYENFCKPCRKDLNLDLKILLGI